MKIIIGADIVPTISNESYFINGDIDFLFGKELCDLFDSADFKILNLEVPLVENKKPIEKHGPNLIANPKTINAFCQAGIDMLTLANNHIMDQGIDGLNSTISVLNDNSIRYVGVGNNNIESSQPAVFEIDGAKIGVYACVEHEFSYATEDKAGANPFDPLKSYDDIKVLKSSCDYVIVLYHGGKELYRYPSPNLQKYCRKFIDCGADIVVCQHSHCIGCEEKHNGGTIVYGQGNFLFDHSTRTEWNTSLLIVIEDGTINYVPLVKYNERVRIADKDSSERIIEDFNTRSKEILNKGFIEKQFETFSNGLLHQYLWEFSGASNSLFLRIINRLSNYRFSTAYVNHKYSREQKVRLLNYIECESHNEVIRESLKHLFK